MLLLGLLLLWPQEAASCLDAFVAGAAVGLAMGHGMSGPSRAAKIVVTDDIDLLVVIVLLGDVGLRVRLLGGRHRGVLCVGPEGAAHEGRARAQGRGGPESGLDLVEHVDVEVLEREDALCALAQGQADVAPPLVSLLVGGVEQLRRVAGHQGRAPHAVGLDRIVRVLCLDVDVVVGSSRRDEEAAHVCVVRVVGGGVGLVAAAGSRHGRHLHVEDVLVLDLDDRIEVHARVGHGLFLDAVGGKQVVQGRLGVGIGDVEVVVLEGIGGHVTQQVGQVGIVLLALPKAELLKEGVGG